LLVSLIRRVARLDGSGTVGQRLVVQWRAGALFAVLCYHILRQITAI
jgi:hypothetical protein